MCQKQLKAEKVTHCYMRKAIVTENMDHSCGKVTVGQNNIIYCQVVLLSKRIPSPACRQV